MGKISDQGSGMNILDHISESLETIFWVKILKFLKAYPDTGSAIFLTLDLRSGMEKFGSGIKIPDPQHLDFLCNREINMANAIYLIML
jgi:hypothetical protein